MMKSLGNTVLAAAMMGLALGQPAHEARADDAATYPQRPVQVIVPYAPGGTTDIIARIVSAQLSRELGQTFVVVNKPGAGGALGSEYAAKQPADGYTLVMAVESSHAVNPNVYKERRYDPVKDFTPISNLADVPNVLVVNPALPAKDFAAFLAEIKANPGKYNFGSSGYGGLSHMNGELFMTVTGAKLQHIPYKGLGPALADLMTGQISIVFDNIPSSAPFIAAGKIRPLAVAAPERLKILPDVPTYKELGLDAMSNPSWFGIAAPAGLPRPILDKLNGAIRTALSDPEVVAAIEKQGAIPAPTTPEAFAALIAQQNESWAKIVAEIKFEKL